MVRPGARGSRRRGRRVDRPEVCRGSTHMPVLWSVSHATSPGRDHGPGNHSSRGDGGMRRRHRDACHAFLSQARGHDGGFACAQSGGHPSSGQAGCASMPATALWGALAIVAVSEEDQQQARLLGSVSDRPWKIFRDVCVGARLARDPSVVPAATGAQRPPSWRCRDGIGGRQATG